MGQDQEILEGLVYAIRGFDSNQTKKEYLETLCRPFAFKLVETLKNLEQNPLMIKDMNTDDVENALVKLATVAKKLTPLREGEQDHPFAAIFDQLWPIIVIFFEKFQVISPIALFSITFTQDHLDVIECLCKLCKNTMRCIFILFKPYAVKFFEIITNNYSVSDLSRLFDHNNSLSPGRNTLFRRISTQPKFASPSLVKSTNSTNI